MCDPAPEVQAPTPDDGNRVFYVGAGLTFVLSVGCMVANFIKPGSVPPEVIWPFGSVILGHKVSSDWRRMNQ